MELNNNEINSLNYLEHEENINLALKYDIDLLALSFVRYSTDINPILILLLSFIKKTNFQIQFC